MTISRLPLRLTIESQMTIENITEAIAESYSDTDPWEATDKAKTIMMEIDNECC